jgi:hypothetical protein
MNYIPLDRIAIPGWLAPMLIDMRTLDYHRPISIVMSYRFATLYWPNQFPTAIFGYPVKITDDIHNFIIGFEVDHE